MQKMVEMVEVMEEVMVEVSHITTCRRPVFSLQLAWVGVGVILSSNMAGL